MKLVECVPNFSEGRDQSVLDAIARAIEAVEGVRLLDRDPGVATHRTVFTFVGDQQHIVDAAFEAIRVAAEHIDMRHHQGEHARMGATDVCPFVPLQGSTMQECVELARRLGKRVGDELGIPVYLYEEAASRPERRNLATIRAGEYEGLAQKLQQPEWAPDFGPARFVPRSGATAIGAREFLVAYNINLNTRDKRLANDVALELREAGRNKRGPDGKFVRDAQGEPIKRPGMFKHVKAVGWYIDEYQRAQISINFTNLNVSPVHEVFDAACDEAAKRGLRVTGSELIGLVPLQTLVQAGRFFLSKQGRSTGVPEAELIHIAVRSLGLDELTPFDPHEKIIEYRVRETAKQRLRRLSVEDFVLELGSESPAPGGGSVAALCGALSAALVSMVANLTHNPLRHQLPLEELDRLACRAQEHLAALLDAVDADTAAFDALIEAMRLPRDTEEQSRERDQAIRQATRHATEVPLGVVQAAAAVAELTQASREIGNPATLSDSGVAAATAVTAATGAYYNVLINLAGLGDEDAGYVKRIRQEAMATWQRAVDAASRTQAAVQERLDSKLA
jgi:glutamate formiminotransferase/formiminotetrahydrofolate cyclodeaminase